MRMEVPGVEGLTIQAKTNAISPTCNYYSIPGG